MPSGAKKRKAAKKKKVNDSSTISSHQAVVVEKKEESSSENKSNEEKGNIEIEVRSKSKSSHGSSSSSSTSSDDESNVVEKNVVVLESVSNESVPAVESDPEKIPPIVDPVKPVDSLLEEVSQVFDEIENEKKKDLVVEEHTVVVESVKENDVEKFISLNERASSVSKDDVSSSTTPKNLISEGNFAECATGTDANGYSNRQAPAASPAVAVQNTTTWKSCCGLFELFSGSDK